LLTTTTRATEGRSSTTDRFLRFFRFLMRAGPSTSRSSFEFLEGAKLFLGASFSRGTVALLG
jgi:hypothetical protein